MSPPLLCVPASRNCPQDLTGHHPGHIPLQLILKVPAASRRSVQGRCSAALIKTPQTLKTCLKILGILLLKSRFSLLFCISCFPLPLLLSVGTLSTP